MTDIDDAKKAIKEVGQDILGTPKHDWRNSEIKGVVDKALDQAKGALKDGELAQDAQEALKKAAVKVFDRIFRNSDGTIEFDARSITIQGDPMRALSRSNRPTFPDLKIELVGNDYVINGTARYDPPGSRQAASDFNIEDANFRIGHGPRKGALSAHFDNLSGVAKPGGTYLDIHITNMRIPREVMDIAVADEVKAQMNSQNGSSLQTSSTIRAPQSVL